VDAGQVTVEDDDLIRGRVELCRGVQAVIGDVGGESVVPESFGDVIGQARDVLDD
jgi:hypothetical protein